MWNASQSRLRGQQKRSGCGGQVRENRISISCGVLTFDVSISNTPTALLRTRWGGPRPESVRLSKLTAGRGLSLLRMPSFDLPEDLSTICDCLGSGRSTRKNSHHHASDGGFVDLVHPLAPRPNRPKAIDQAPDARKTPSQDRERATQRSRRRPNRV